MTGVWDNIQKAQSQHKVHHGRHACPHTFQEGERVFMFMPAARSGKPYKLSRPFHGPYRIIRVVENGVEVRPVDKPQLYNLSCGLNHVRRYNENC